MDRNAPLRLGRCAPRAVRRTYPCRAGGRAWGDPRDRHRSVRRAGRRHVRWFLVPPCVARPGGLFSTSACVVPVNDEAFAGEFDLVIAQRTDLSRRTLGRDALQSRRRRRRPGGTRIDLTRRRLVIVGLGARAVDDGAARCAPICAKRRLKLVSGRCRLNQRSSRMPSSSTPTLNWRTSEVALLGFGVSVLMPPPARAKDR